MKSNDRPTTVRNKKRMSIVDSPVAFAAPYDLFRNCVFKGEPRFLNRIRFTMLLDINAQKSYFQTPMTII